MLVINAYMYLEWSRLCDNKRATSLHGAPCFYIIIFFLQVLSGDPGEDPQVHACKLLEVVVLQCQGRIDNVSKSSLVGGLVVSCWNAMCDNGSFCS